MLRTRRTLLLALLALAVPLPALALSGHSRGAPPTPAPLSVSTSLGGCGVATNQIMCKLVVSFNPIPGATSYTASVTRADGSVIDYGEIGAGGGPLWVPYAGSGSYSVRVSAFGRPPTANVGDDAGNEPIASETTAAAPATKPSRAPGNPETAENPGARPGKGGPKGNATAIGNPGAPAQQAPDPVCAPQPATTPDPPALPEPPPTNLDPEDPDEDRDGILDEEERQEYVKALLSRTAAALAAQAKLPDSATCAEAPAP